MRAEKHVGCVMNERRKRQAGCGADESMYVHSEQRRNFQSKPFHESTAFTLLPLRPQPYGDTGLSSRGSELLGLQVQGFCCPLQQRPSSGRVTHRVTPQSRNGVDGSLTLLSSLNGRLESRTKLASRFRTGSRPEMTPEFLFQTPTVCHHRDPVSGAAETPTTPCDNKRQAPYGHPGAAKVSELHLYLPSSLCYDEEQDPETEEMRTLAEETSAQESKVKPNNVNPSHTSQDQPGPGAPQHTF
ncbi:uncharacterized protein LOC123959608 isoform X1 [Micropterus dolomieu]|uniref:uncharacterized protein LOC123959608 isoform X1 n=1 Tax=Micropterus dolomieu TaxID=147949 RepID=UPI001E8E1A9A|nr:uncharacterized protein LOC123959608 isoform X1 [Micropterus dolomieu]